MTPEDTTVVAGIPIPSTSPIFLTVVGLHVLVGLVCVLAGAVAMLSPKRSGRHPTFGTIYYWGLVAVFVSATGLSVGPRIITCSFSGCWLSSPPPSGARPDGGAGPAG